MAEMGIGRRAAYDVVRKRKAAEIDTNGVGQNQKTAIMAVLISRPETGKNTDTLIAAVHEAGLRISGHDVQKTLWALSKVGHLSFRTRNLTGRRTMVYAIKPTDAGLAAFRAPALPPSDAAIATVTTDEDGHVEAVWGPPEAPEATEAPVGWREPSGAIPWYTVAPDIEGYPAIKAVLDRAAKATKINAAARLLEEAGEEDVALTLYGKTEFNQLEQEIIALLGKETNL